MKEIINKVKRSRFSHLTLVLIEVLNSDNIEQFSDGTVNITDENKTHVFFSISNNHIIIYDHNIRAYYWNRYKCKYKIDYVIEAIKNSRWSEYNII